MIDQWAQWPKIISRIRQVIEFEENPWGWFYNCWFSAKEGARMLFVISQRSENLQSKWVSTRVLQWPETSLGSTHWLLVVDEIYYLEALLLTDRSFKCFKYLLILWNIILQECCSDQFLFWGLWALCLKCTVSLSIGTYLQYT